LKILLLDLKSINKQKISPNYFFLYYKVLFKWMKLIYF
jgi:hypothetical protein